MAEVVLAAVVLAHLKFPIIDVIARQNSKQKGNVCADLPQVIIFFHLLNIHV